MDTWTDDGTDTDIYHHVPPCLKSSAVMNNWYSHSANASSSSDYDSPLSNTSNSSSSQLNFSPPIANSTFLPSENDENASLALAIPTKRIRNVRKSDKYHCAICGDKPTGYHYDVLSCNGCKTFFRRTIINKRDFKCSKGGKCQFNKDFRCACRACRFQKCIRVGMNRNAIQFREKDDIDSATLEETTDNNNDDVAVVPILYHTISYQPENMDCIKALTILTQRENLMRAIRKPGYPIVSNLHLREILQSPCLLGARKIKDPQDQRIWRQELYEENPVRYWMMADLFLSVEFAKTFNSFGKLSPKDKSVLLSEVAGIMQISSQAYYTALTNSESMVFPDGLNALKFRLRNQTAYEDYYRQVYCKPVAMMRLLDLSDAEFVFFKTLALFSGNTFEISDEGRKIIEAARYKTMEFLRKHMIREYGQIYGVQKFGRVVTALTSFLELAERRRSYLEVCHLMSTVNLSPISRSIFLKQRDRNQNIQQLIVVDGTKIKS